MSGDTEQTPSTALLRVIERMEDEQRGFQVRFRTPNPNDARRPRPAAHSVPAIAALDSALAKAKIPEDIVVFRGTRAAQAEVIKEAYAAGQIAPSDFIDISAYITTLLTPPPAFLRAIEGGIRWIIAVPKDSPGAYTGEIAGSHLPEILFPRNSALMVMGLRMDGATLEIGARYVDPDTVQRTRGLSTSQANLRLRMNDEAQPLRIIHPPATDNDVQKN